MDTILLETTRFGTVDYTDADIITFPQGLVGFRDHRKFLVLAHKPGSPFRWLQSIDEPQLAFLIGDPETWLDDYLPRASEAEARTIGLEADTPRLLFVTITIPHGQPEAMTLNLCGPLVVNALTRQAMQIVLADETYTTKHRVTQKTDRVGAAAA
jgi:flagellar assembly factor FliW